MLLKKIYTEYSHLSEYGKSLSLLLVRFIVAYTFYGPAMMKWADIDSVAMWFGSMGIPFPTLNAYMSASTEIVGVVLLTLGLMTRAIAIPLIIIMFVAIATVHGANGFNVIVDGSEIVNPWINGHHFIGTIVTLQNGFEMPLYYILFLFVLLTQGAGKFSLDRLIFGEKN